MNRRFCCHNTHNELNSPDEFNSIYTSHNTVEFNCMRTLELNSSELIKFDDCASTYKTSSQHERCRTTVSVIDSNDRRGLSYLGSDWVERLKGFFKLTLVCIGIVFPL